MFSWKNTPQEPEEENMPKGTGRVVSAGDVGVGEIRKPTCRRSGAVSWLEEVSCP